MMQDINPVWVIPNLLGCANKTVMDSIAIEFYEQVRTKNFIFWFPSITTLWISNQVVIDSLAISLHGHSQNE